MSRELSNKSPWNNAPALIFWELSQACGLQCKHCRAEAVPERAPGELSTNLIKEHLTKLGDEMNGVVVFTGGDPFRRPDLEELIATCDEAGLKAGLTPSTTPLLTQDRLKTLKDAGLKMVALSLDGSDAFTQDEFRGEESTFIHTLRGIRATKSLDLPLQINTTICKETYPDLEEIGKIVGEADVFRWALFFLVRTGQGKKLKSLNPEETLEVFRYLKEWSDDHSAQVKTTNAPHYKVWKIHEHDASFRPGIVDGDGIMFISHTGEVYPSGFLPVSCGNIKETDPLTIYRNNELFNQIRNRKLTGRCQSCKYRRACGGSRANAYAENSGPLASDPRCNFDPSDQKFTTSPTYKSKATLKESQ